MSRLDDLIAEVRVPGEIEHCRIVVSASGGKDSTACLLLAKELGFAEQAVFADTGWEAPETYAYLDLLERRVGIPIARVHPERDMIAAIRRRSGFPARRQRWCTRELKLHPLAKWIQDQELVTGDDYAMAVGVRAGESESRAKMGPVEEQDKMGWAWRPILTWTIEDVLLMHRRHDVPVNPLYQVGYSRVGCFPCIMSGREDLRVLADHAPERIDLIEQLEHEMTVQRAEKNAEQPGRYAHPEATFFQTRYADGPPMRIREQIAWAQADRGGRQLPMFKEPPDGGCFRWGLCEAPADVMREDD